MIKHIIKEKVKEKSDPYYRLRFNYMIGDANGNTHYDVELSTDNPYIERFCKLVNSLKPLQGHWGVVLNRWDFPKYLEQNLLSEDDYNFLETTLFDEDYDDDDELEINPTSTLYDVKKDEYLGEFYEGVRCDIESSFLVFKGVDLHYYDEYGVKHKTEFVD
jgi:hypothetical protein